MRKTDTILKELRQFGLAYPGVTTKSPWPGHDDLAVKNKTFAYLSLEAEPFSISLKLPFTGGEALRLPFAKPTGYGLGKSGWVTFEPTSSQMPSLAQLKSWLDESYRAQAPKKLARRMSFSGAVGSLQADPRAGGDGSWVPAKPSVLTRQGTG